MNSNMNTYEYSVVPEEIDFKGQITVPSLCGHVINAIGQNIRKEGFGIDVMQKENKSWILRRSAFEIDDRPGLYSPLFVTVWPVSKGGLTFYRCIKITDAQGRELGRGTTEWCMIDISSRRPIYPGEDLDICGKAYSLPCEGPKRIRDFSPETLDDRKVGYSDCDFNGHLNNTRYIEMIFDLLPDEVVDGTSPLRLDLNFKKEIRKGARLSIGLKQERSDEFLFIARSGDQTLCSASVMRN